MRRTRWAIAVGLIVWFVALVLPGWDIGLLLFSGAIVASTAFGLMVGD